MAMIEDTREKREKETGKRKQRKKEEGEEPRELYNRRKTVRIQRGRGEQEQERRWKEGSK
jgi:hypothetical protein